jgi:hypothetical protein
LRGEIGGFPFEVLPMLVVGQLRGEVVGFPFEALLMLVPGFAVRAEAASAISGFPLSAGLRGEVGGFPFEALLMLVVSFAVRTEAAFAISGLLPLRSALNMAVDRRLDFVLLAFLAMGSPAEGCVMKSCSPKKGAMRAPLCLSSSRQGGRTALMLGRVNLFGGCVQRRLVGERQGVRKVPSCLVTPRSAMPGRGTLIIVVHLPQHQPSNNAKN